MEQGLVNKLTKIRQMNPTLASEELKVILREVEFKAEDFMEEVVSIRNTKKSYLKGGASSSPRSKMSLVS